MARSDLYLTAARLAAVSANRFIGSRFGVPQVVEMPRPPHVTPDLPPAPEDAPAHDWWGAHAEELMRRGGVGWLDNQYVIDRHAMRLAFGNGYCGNWGEQSLKRFGVPRGGSWLSLGCGGGGLEVSFGALGLYGRMDAYDYSERAIEVGRKIAADQGIDTIRFGTMDVNEAELPSERYDVVHMNMSFHHVHRIEHLLWQLRRTLKPGGWLLLNEYIGPNQFQLSDPQIRAVRELLDVLPDRLRFNYVGKFVKRQYPIYSRSFWNEFDPTEAARSEDIPHAVRVAFPNVEQCNYAGGILNPMLENIIGNFNLADEGDRTVLDMLLWADITLTRAGVVPHNFAYFAARKVPSALADAAAALAARTEVRYRLTKRLRPHGWA